MIKNIAIFSSSFLLATTALAASSNLTLEKKVKLLEEKIEKIENVKSVDSTPVVTIGGRIDTDYAFIMRENPSKSNGAAIRKARINAKGKIENDWKYKFEVDFAKNQSKINKAYFEFIGFNNSSIKLGRNYFQFGLDNEDKFLESHPASGFNQFVEDGLQASTYGNNWTLHAGLGMNDAAQSSKSEDQMKAGLLRATFAPIILDKKILQFGLSGVLNKPTNNNYSSEFSFKPDTKIADNSLSTGSITNIKKIGIYGVDAVYLDGPFSAQAEYIKTKINRDNLKNLDFKGGYLQFSYVLTGESRQYFKETGALDAPTPFKSFKFGQEGYNGAFEIATRYSVIDLNSDPSFNKGKMQTYTLGLNWYLNSNISMMLDAVYSKTDKNSTVLPNRKFKGLMLRTHIGF